MTVRKFTKLLNKLQKIDDALYKNDTDELRGKRNEILYRLKKETNDKLGLIDDWYWNGCEFPFSVHKTFSNGKSIDIDVDNPKQLLFEVML